MNSIQTFGSALGLVLLGAPALAVMALALRGTGGLQLSPTEGVVVAVMVTLAGVVRAACGAFTLDDPFVAPLLLAAPMAIGLHFGPRVAVASTAASWWLFAVLALANDAPTREGSGAALGGLIVAATVATLAGLYAPLGARRHRLLGYLPLALLAVPAFASASDVWADPTTWVGWVAAGAWVVALERRLALAHA